MMAAWAANTVSATARSGSRARAGCSMPIVVATYGAAGAMPCARATTRRCSHLRAASDEIGTCMAVSRCAESLPCRTARSMPMRATPCRQPIEADTHRYATAHLLQFEPPLLRLCQFGSTRRRLRPRTALSCFATLHPQLSPNATHADHPRHAAHVAAARTTGRSALRDRARASMACDLRDWLRTGPGSPPCRPGHVLAAVRPQ